MSIINFFSSLFFFLMSVLFISITLPRAVVDLKLDQVIRYGIVIVVLILATVVLLVVKPQLLNWLLQKITAVSGHIWKKNRGKKISEKIAENVIQFKDYIYLFLTRERPTLFLSFGITIILYLNKYLIAYVIVKGLNLSPSLWDVFYIQTLQFFLLYFSPTPGSAGAAEVSSAFLMSKLVPLYQLPVFVVLWRFFVTYVGVMLGGWITLKDLNEFFKEKEMRAEKLAQKPQLASS